MPLPSKKYLVLLMVIGMLGGCQKPIKTPARPVRAQQVQLTNLSMQFSYAGVVQAYHDTALSFQVGGKIVNRYVEVGDTVKPGKLLADIDTKDLKLDTQHTEAELAAAQSNLVLSKSNLDRYAPLVKSGYVSKLFYHEAKTRYENDLAAVEKMKSALELTQRKQNYSNLYADYSGIITSVEASAGQVVSAGQVIMRMARDDEKDVVINVPEQRIEQWKNINKIEVTLWAYPNKIYSATIREIAGQADPVTRTYTVKLKITDADAKIRLGMTANVKVEEVHAEPRVVLPLTAIYYESKYPAVWVINTKKMTVYPVKVKLGSYDKNQIIVESGIKAGQWVVTAGVNSLYAGQKVTVVKE